MRALRFVHWLPSLFLPALLAGALAAAEPPPSVEAPLQLAVVGDSTAADYPARSAIHGWGEFLQPRFRSRIRVTNFSIPGISAKSFLVSANWKALVKARPDIVLIQLGINDSWQHLDARTDFRSNLNTMITRLQRTGSTPILLTPVSSRRFDDQGKLVEWLVPYRQTIKAVAAQTGVKVIDLNASSAALYAKLGPMGSAQLAAKGGDDVHCNELGALAMAELILRDLPAVEPRLRREILQRTPGPGE